MFHGVSGVPLVKMERFAGVSAWHVRIRPMLYTWRHAKAVYHILHLMNAAKDQKEKVKIFHWQEMADLLK